MAVLSRGIASLLLAFAAAGSAHEDLAAPPALRAELHIHLDGSIPTQVLWEVCVQRGIELREGAGVPASPADVEGVLAELPPWRKFDVVNDIVGGDAAVIGYVSENFLASQAQSGIVYTEVRYDPVRLARSKYASKELSLDATVRAVQEGLASGMRKYKVRAHQLLCAMRGKSADQCFQVAHLAKRMQSAEPGGVVGMDLAGDEVAFPNGPYVECLKYAKFGLRLNTTAHVGEFSLNMTDDVNSAVLDMGVDRIGHGYAATASEASLKMLLDRGIHVEACPKSALRHGLLPAIGEYKSRGLKFGVNTDDPADWIVNTSATEDEALLREHLNFTTRDFALAYRHELSAAFGPTQDLVEFQRRVDACDVCERVVSGVAAGGSYLACWGTCVGLAWHPPMAALCGTLCALIQSGACRATGPDECARKVCTMAKLCRRPPRASELLV